MTVNAVAGASGAIPYNCTAAQLQAALDAMANVGAGNSVVTGAPLPSGTLQVDLQGALAGAGIGSLTLATNSMTGGSAPAPVLTNVFYGAPFSPWLTAANAEMTAENCVWCHYQIGTNDSIAAVPLAQIQRTIAGTVNWLVAQGRKVILSAPPMRFVGITDAQSDVLRQYQANATFLANGSTIFVGDTGTSPTWPTITWARPTGPTRRSASRSTAATGAARSRTSWPPAAGGGGVSKSRLIGGA